MRTNIVINDKLMTEAKHLTGLKTKKEVVNNALELLVRMQKQQAIREFRGKLDWDDDLEATRNDIDPVIDLVDN